ncbi:MAG: hypothetical protein DPW09_02170 [Anaerolineae bacterium]|nr:hypothetical protein [Anaerolineae bacterium]MCQ3972235.1 hypothetical protein [Anaerolineae bacterium]
MRLPWTFIFVGLLTACSQPTLPPSPSTATPPKAVEAISSIPAPTLAPTLVETILSSPVPTVPTIPTKAAQPPPALVWLPYGSASRWFNQQLLTVRAGQLSREPTPVTFEIFWDYSPLSGRLAYASQQMHGDTMSNQRGVSDLWVYDYNSGRSELWLVDDVSRALWSPTPNPQTGLPPLAVALRGEILALVSGSHQLTILNENASSIFSWSPDGRWLAFTKGQAVFVTSVESGKTRQIAAGEDKGGWVGEKPAWALEHQALIYAAEPFKIAKLDGSEAFTPVTATGEKLPGDRVQHMLWSPKQLRLVAYSETPMGGGQNVTVYQLSEDLRTVVYSYTLEDVSLVDWLVPDESIILDRGPVWSLTGNAPLGQQSKIASTHLSPDGRWRVEMTRYECVGVRESEEKAYEQLKLIRVSDGVEQIIDQQLLACDDAGTRGIVALYWSLYGRYFYYTKGAPGLCGAWERPYYRLEAAPLNVTHLGSGALSPDATKIATWQSKPPLAETFEPSPQELVVWDINEGELVRSTTRLNNGWLGALAWSPNSRALVYLTFEAPCPPLGQTQAVRLDWPDLTETLLFTSKTPSFSSLVWDDPAELSLFDESGQVWKYRFRTQSLEPAP